MATQTRYRLHNPGRAGVTYDRAGHTLGGGERVTVEKIDEVGKHAVARGRLVSRKITVDVEPSKPGGDPPTFPSPAKAIRGRKTEIPAPAQGSD
ncbi:MAG: hypothetical protein ACRDTZ_04665 [Pseudonocardiaceae bacterium]